jgi:FixJ family two-component response regulator
MSFNPVVVLAIGDNFTREFLETCLRRKGLAHRALSSVDEIFDLPLNSHGCIVAELDTMRMTGRDLLRELCRHKSRMPLIFVSSRGDVETAVELIRKGAFDFLELPCDPDLFVQRVKAAIQHDTEMRRRLKSQTAYAELFESLTRREREVLDLIIEGKLTKQIAKQLDVSCKTVDVHRSRIMKKMHADSVAALVRMTLEFNKFNKSIDADP